MEPVTLIYDGECPLCQRAADWVAQRARRGKVELLPCQSPERAERFPDIPEQTCMKSIQLVLPGDEVRSGAAALPPLMRRLRGWSWLAAVLELPGFRWAAPRVYQWVAARRYALSRVAECRGGECEQDNEDTQSKEQT